MRYAQVRFTDQEFISLKKAALDAKLTFEEFLKGIIMKNYTKVSIEEKEKV